ncbi:hypothetical protein [Desulfomonile tiedjei]|nr:hypothetical protein [Desulfomonile tiedjei]
MIPDPEEKLILHGAYIPEHSIPLMVGISGGEPYLINGYFFCRVANRIILIGYPIGRDFDADDFRNTIEMVKSKYDPIHIAFIAPELPSGWFACSEHESDEYLTLQLEQEIPGRLKTVAEKAGRQVSVEVGKAFTQYHKELGMEFIERVSPPPRIRALMDRMEHYLASANDAFLLNAWTAEGELAAFYVLDLWPAEFATYVIGCYSKEPYVPYVSDLLFLEMIKLSRAKGKTYIHLGLGVNEGIRRFKRKWGGVPSRKYELCELAVRQPRIAESLMSYLNRIIPQ